MTWDAGTAIVVPYWDIHKAYELTGHSSVRTAELVGIFEGI